MLHVLYSGTWKITNFNHTILPIQVFLTDNTYNGIAGDHCFRLCSDSVVNFSSKGATGDYALILLSIVPAREQYYTGFRVFPARNT